MKNLTWVLLFTQLFTLSCIVNADAIDPSAQQLSGSYWIAKLNHPAAAQHSESLLSRQQIAHFNTGLQNNNPNIVDPLAMPPSLDKHTLLALIDQAGSVPDTARFYADDTRLTARHYQPYVDNQNKAAVAASNNIRWGMVVRRASLRAFPTDDRVFNEAMDSDIDRFQESAVFPAEAVAVLHQSKDKHWYLVQNYHYLAWVAQAAVAIGDKAQISQFSQAEPFVVISGSKVFTNHVPNHPEISRLQLDMGVKLPLLPASKINKPLHGQDSHGAYAVKLPTRTPQGKLAFSPALIARHQDVSVGYLPFNRQNIIRQAFKFLGERYGWGHDYNGRDCTGFVGEIYKSFGILMPRNSGQQDRGQYGMNSRFDENTTLDDRMKTLKSLAVGDLIYIPGHVMMYLGQDQGQPYVIHDVKGVNYFNPQGELDNRILNGVSVSPLLPLRASKKETYVDLIGNIKRIR